MTKPDFSGLGRQRGLGLLKRDDGGIPTTVLNGLTSARGTNEARIGNHAAISADLAGIPAVSWSSQAWGVSYGDTTYGTGSSPTDIAGGDGGFLYFEGVGNDAVTYRAVAPIRYAPATTGAALDLAFVEDSAITPTDLAQNWTTTNLTMTWALDTPPTGLSMDASAELTGTPTDVTPDAAYTHSGTDQYGWTLTVDHAIEITAIPAGATSATYNGATMSWTGNRTVGTYADGRPYIVVPTGTLTIDDITPSQTTVGGNVINGAMKNPLNGDTQGFDQRISTFASTKNVTAGVTTVTAGDIVVKAIAEDTVSTSLTSAELRAGVATYAVFYIVASAPAAGTYAPAAVGWAGRGTPTGYSVDTSTAIAALRQLATSGHSASVASYTEVAAFFEQDAPLLGMTQGTTTDGGYEVMAPYQFGGSDPTAANYGQYIHGIMSQASLGIISDGWTAGQAEAALGWMIRHGIDIYDPWEGSTNASALGDGGHYQWALLPVLYGLNYTGRSATITTGLAADIPCNQLRQAFLHTSTTRTQSTTLHTSATQPHNTRSRTVASVSTNDITFETFNPGDPANMRFDRMLMQESGAQQSQVQDTDEIVRGSNQTLTVASGTGFATSDEVYFLPPFAINVGDADWLLESTANVNTYTPSATASYRGANKWSVDVLTIRELGVYDAIFEALEKVVVRTTRTNQPSSDLAYEDPFEDATCLTGITNTGWAEAFWNDHATTLVTIAETTAPTISSSSPADNATGVAVDANITITFGENIRFGYGTIVLRDNDGGWADLETFDLSDPAVYGTGAGQISISGATLTINPTSNLANSIEHAIRISAGAITDLNYNAFAGIANDTTLSFTTAAAASIPTITMAAAVNGTNVAATLPTHSTGDYLYLCTEIRGNDTALTAPSGYTEITGSPFDSGGGGDSTFARFQTFKKTAGASESAPTPGGGYDHGIQVMFAVSGASTEGILGSASSATGTGTTSLSFSSGTTANANSLVVLVAGFNPDADPTGDLTASWANSNLASVTLQSDDFYNYFNIRAAIAVVSGEKAATGAVGNTTGTADGDTDYAGIHLEFGA